MAIDETAKPSGVIVLDKPAGISSAAAVRRVKRLLPRGTKIGHAGTLDPFATGVLLLLVGGATKSCERLMDAPKQYEATLMLGATTATDDPESVAVPTSGATPATLEAVADCLTTFIGTITQRPPAYSALKVGGRRACDIARKGQPLVLQPRPVRVYAIDLLSYEWPLVHLQVDCGRGTYIRALARDVGEALGVGGHLVALRRTSTGAFRVEDAVTLERLAKEGVESHLRQLS